MKKHVVPTLVAVWTALAFQAQGELRVWTDQNGKTIEAEHVRTLTDQVVLRQADGSEIRVSLDTLSERDRKYAILQTPPKISIDVSTDTDRSNTGYSGRKSPQVQQEEISVDVSIRKTSSAPYEAPLRAEMVLIGSPEQKDGYIILGITKEQFSFSEDSEVTFESGKIRLKQLEAGREMGVEYKGYLVAIRDRAGNILEMKCSKLAFEKNAETLLAGERGMTYDGDFEVRGQKNDMKKLNKASKPAPGRRF